MPKNQQENNEHEISKRYQRS